MPNDVIKHVEVNGTTYDIVDAVSGYIKSSDIPVTSVNSQTGAVVLPVPLILKGTLDNNANWKNLPPAPSADAYNPYRVGSFSFNEQYTTAQVQAAYSAGNPIYLEISDASDNIVYFVLTQALAGVIMEDLTTALVFECETMPSVTNPFVVHYVTSLDLNSLSLSNNPVLYKDLFQISQQEYIDILNDISDLQDASTVTDVQVNSVSILDSSGTANFTSTTITDALGYTPYNSTNPNGYITGGTNSSSSVTINTTTDTIYKVTSSGSVSNGSAASFTQGNDIYTAPILTFTPNSGTTGNLGISWTTGSFTQGIDSFTANTPTSVTLPTVSSTSTTVLTGITSATAGAQTFTGTNNIQSRGANEF